MKQEKLKRTKKEKKTNKNILNTNNAFETKKVLKEKLEVLSDYTKKEENFLLTGSLEMPFEKLVLKKDFDKKELKKINKVLRLRIKGKPLNKIFKKTCFFGRNFFINEKVFAPRKETEILVEKLLEYILLRQEKLKILDMCCGSGAIGLTILCQTQNFHDLVLSDIDKNALKATAKNQKNLKTKGKIVKSDCFKNLKSQGKFDIIICNPPYISTFDLKNLDRSTKFDPKISLDGGFDGLKFYKLLSIEAKKFLKKGGALFLEIGWDQEEKVSKLFEKDYEIVCFKDYSENDRVIFAKLKDSKDFL